MFWDLFTKACKIVYIIIIIIIFSNTQADFPKPIPHLRFFHWFPTKPFTLLLLVSNQTNYVSFSGFQPNHLRFFLWFPTKPFYVSCFGFQQNHLRFLTCFQPIHLRFFLWFPTKPFTFLPLVSNQTIYVSSSCFQPIHLRFYSWFPTNPFTFLPLVSNKTIYVSSSDFQQNHLRFFFWFPTKPFTFLSLISNQTIYVSFSDFQPNHYVSSHGFQPSHLHIFLWFPTKPFMLLPLVFNFQQPTYYAIFQVLKWSNQLNESKHLHYYFFLPNTIFCVKPYVPRNPEGTQVIVGSMNMGYISDTARNRTHNLFRSKREPIPLGHNDGLFWVQFTILVQTLFLTKFNTDISYSIVLKSFDKALIFWEISSEGVTWSIFIKFKVQYHH